MTASYSETAAGVVEEAGRFRAPIDPSWTQGRTAYGGFTAALSLEAALRAFPGLAPLRSAQFAFIGPLAGYIDLEASVLRAGKAVTFVNVDAHSEKGLAARSVFCFGAARESMFDRSFAPAPPMTPPEDCEPYIPEGMGPPFAEHFETRLIRGARPATGAAEHDHYLWVRHRDREARSLAALLALADMPPPAMMPMFPAFAPISTAAWSLNMLSGNPQTDDGWWLLQSRAENAVAGYSSQDMIVWNRRGEAVIAGRQTVAIFI